MVYVIALDIGTSSMRAVLFNEQGQVLHASGKEYHTVFPQPSYVEQDPADWTDAARQTLSGIAEYIRDKDIMISAISVTSQRASMIPMSEENQPLRPAIMWQDKRTIEICERLKKDQGLKPLYKKTGLRVNPFFVLNKIIWLRENEPDIFNKTAKFIGVQDFVIYQLTGQYVTDWTQASRTLLMDLRSCKWDPDLLALAGISADQLCALVPPGTISGVLTEAFAQTCGLGAGIPVVVSGGDQQNAAIALGVTRPGTAEANTGTGSFVLSYAKKPAFDSNCRVLCQAGAIAGSYVTETPIFNTGAILRWFKEQFCREFLASDNPYYHMDLEAAQAPVGSNGVVLMPHFEGSAAPNWNPSAKGLFFNLGLSTTRGMMIRAILEGISLEIAQNLELMRKMIGEITEVHVAGGMTRSDLFCRIQASACQATVIRQQNPEASALGACCNGLIALGVVKTAEEFFSTLEDGKATFEPDEEASNIYKLVMQRRKLLFKALDDVNVFEQFMGIRY